MQVFPFNGVKRISSNSRKISKTMTKKKKTFIYPIYNYNYICFAVFAFVCCYMLYAIFLKFRESLFAIFRFETVICVKSCPVI